MSSDPGLFVHEINGAWWHSADQTMCYRQVMLVTSCKLVAAIESFKNKLHVSWFCKSEIVRDIEVASEGMGITSSATSKGGLFNCVPVALLYDAIF